MRKVLSVFTLLIVSLLVLATGKSTVYATNVNDFEIKNYDINYYLSKDNEGRSTLRTEEVISAVFPQINQNHGIERAIPNSYDGHSTSLQVVSVTDALDKPLNYTIYSTNGNNVIRIGDADVYVHGLQTYKIIFIQRDVTRYFSDTNYDEFYWDTNGAQWAVPIRQLSVRLHLSSNLFTTLTSNQQCYVGSTGSTEQCVIRSTDDGFAAKTDDLTAYENMTIAIGFQPKTFTPYKKSIFELIIGIWFVLFILTMPVAGIILVWFAVRNYQKSNRTNELKPIIPEYLPPKDASVSTAGSIVGKTSRVFSAQLIDLAVRRYIKIYQTKEKSLFKSAQYEIEIVKDVRNLKKEEQELLSDIFVDPRVGARIDMETLKNNPVFGVSLSDNKKKLDTSIKGQYKLRAMDSTETKWFRSAAAITLLASVVTFSPWLFATSLAAFIYSFTLKPLTDKGLVLSRYLRGLEMYIKVAESERLKMLQSPKGALKISSPIDTSDKRQLVKLYEQVLPYAVLFGQEKDWNKQLGQYYQSLNESPTWFASNSGVFNAVMFSSAISNFSSVASYSSPSSSSSGGSSGGGFSGGGGGGGGGGGW